MSEEASNSHGPTVPAAQVHSSLFDEVESAESSLVLLTDVPAPVADHPNQWYVEGKYLVYRDTKMLKNKGVMTRTLTVELRVLTESLHCVPDAHALFTRDRLEGMDRSVGHYREEVVREFYASYVETLQCFMDRRSNLIQRAPLYNVRVCGINKDSTREPFTPEFYYRWTLIKESHFKRDAGVRESIKRWIAQHILMDGEGANWVLEPRGTIKKANLTFVAIFIWLLVHHFLSPTFADNILTRDSEILVATMVA